MCPGYARSNPDARAPDGSCQIAIAVARQSDQSSNGKVKVVVQTIGGKSNTASYTFK